MNLDLDDFDRVASCGEYDYAWTEGVLWRHKTNGVLLWGVTSGCSCYGYEDNIFPEDMIVVDSWQDALALAKDDFTEREVADFAAQLLPLPGNCAPKPGGTASARSRAECLAAADALEGALRLLDDDEERRDPRPPRGPVAHGSQLHPGGA